MGQASKNRLKCGKEQVNIVELKCKSLSKRSLISSAKIRKFLIMKASNKQKNQKKFPYEV